MKIKVIVTGVTGMVGEGVLQQCLQNPEVEQVLIINRRTSGFSHPKLKEIIHKDFFDLSSIREKLSGYNACYFCLGVSSVGMKEEEYTKFTYALTMNFAKTLSELNPEMTFCYVSGKATDGTEKGKLMWARVKGKTENDLMKLPFKKVFAFRPGFLRPEKGAKNVLKAYSYLGWIYPIVKLLAPNSACDIAHVGQAMIAATQFGYEKQVVEVSDIIALSKKKSS